MRNLVGLDDQRWHRNLVSENGEWSSRLQISMEKIRKRELKYIPVLEGQERKKKKNNFSCVFQEYLRPSREKYNKKKKKVNHDYRKSNKWFYYKDGSSLMSFYFYIFLFFFQLPHNSAPIYIIHHDLYRISKLAGRRKK